MMFPVWNVMLAQRRVHPEEGKNNYVVSSSHLDGKRGHASYEGQFQTIAAEQNSIINHFNIDSILQSHQNHDLILLVIYTITMK